MRSFRIVGMVFWFVAGGAPAQESNEPEQLAVIRDYSNWYQIEVLAFANRYLPETDEIWPLAELAYPDNMVSISPLADEDIKPHDIRQLDHLLSDALDSPVDARRTGEDGLPLAEDSRGSARAPLPGATMSAGGPDMTEGLGAAEEALLEQLFSPDYPRAFRMIAPEALSLANIARSLRRSSRYRLLQHLAWRQPLEEEEFPVLIQAGDRYDGLYELEGTLTVSRARFLHVSTDLWFTEFVPQYAQPRFGPVEDPFGVNLDRETLKQYPQLVAWAQQENTYLPIHTHPLTQSRRMRSDTIHYLDHPFFGIVIQVTEFEYGLEEEDEDQTDQ